MAQLFKSQNHSAWKEPCKVLQAIVRANKLSRKFSLSCLEDTFNN